MHVHPYAVDIAWRAGKESLIAVSDAMAAMALAPGRHKLGELDVDVKADGAYPGVHAVLAGTTTLAGAVCPLDACVRHLRAFTGATVPEAIACATTHPATALGLTGTLGSLAPGAWADLVLLDDALQPLQTYIAGELAFTSPPSSSSSLSHVPPPAMP